MIFKTIEGVLGAIENQAEPGGLYHGDSWDLLKKIPDESIHLIITSPPYCMGKKYEETNDIQLFIDSHKKIFPEIVRIAKPGASICWQVGFHVKNGAITPLDFLVHDIISKEKDIFLRNRIVWTFGHGLHCSNRFSGRYEVIMWYTKGNDYTFNLDSVRIPQRYPGKRYAKGPKKGEFSGNPKGKNPSDIWEIPNVKANHIEKEDHPCQFPVAIAQRLIQALSNEKDIVFDPYAGTSSTGVAAIIEKRRYLGAEIDDQYIEISKLRLNEAKQGIHRIRPLEKDIYKPKPNEKVAIKPEHFWEKLEDCDI